MFSEQLVLDIREWRTPHPPISFPRPAILHGPRLSTIYTEIKPPARKRSCLFRIILQSVPLPFIPSCHPRGREFVLWNPLMFTKKDKNIPALQIKTNGSPRDEIALFLINQFTFVKWNPYITCNKRICYMFLWCETTERCILETLGFEEQSKRKKTQINKSPFICNETSYLYFIYKKLSKLT